MAGIVSPQYSEVIFHHVKSRRVVSLREKRVRKLHLHSLHTFVRAYMKLERNRCSKKIKYAQEERWLQENSRTTLNTTHTNTKWAEIF